MHINPGPGNDICHRNWNLMCGRRQLFPELFVIYFVCLGLMTASGHVQVVAEGGGGRGNRDHHLNEALLWLCQWEHIGQQLLSVPLDEQRPEMITVKQQKKRKLSDDSLQRSWGGPLYRCLVSCQFCTVASEPNYDDRPATRTRCAHSTASFHLDLYSWLSLFIIGNHVSMIFHVFF